MIASILIQAFEQDGLDATLVGGSAIELFAPGIYKSDDLDFVVEGKAESGIRDRIHDVLTALGFERDARHWHRGRLYVEVPGHSMLEPTQLVSIGAFRVKVVTKEVLLADRIVGFRQWGYTGHGQQAIDMIAAFGTEIDEEFLIPRLKKEGSLDAFEPLKRLGASGGAVSEEVLQALLAKLRGV